MKILICDDEKSLVKAVSAILARNNYTVECAYDGKEALDHLLYGEYDAAILDIMMPKYTGIEVLKKIRENGINIPVILLTAKSEIDDKVEGLDCGANDYMTKPFDMRELLARLRAVTRQADISNTSVISFSNISLDRKTYELSSPVSSFRLANKEYQIMELLISSKNCVVSQDTLLEKVWGFENESDSNVVWVYISYLRKKLAALDANVIIKAVRNAGYVLEEKND